MGKNVVGNSFWAMGRKFIQQKDSLATPSLNGRGLLIDLAKG